MAGLRWLAGQLRAGGLWGGRRRRRRASVVVRPAPASHPAHFPPPPPNGTATRVAEQARRERTVILALRSKVAAGGPIVHQREGPSPLFADLDCAVRGSASVAPRLPRALSSQSVHLAMRARATDQRPSARDLRPAGAKH